MPQTISRFQPHILQDALQRWYKKHGRALPWRAHAGRAETPYHTWLAEIMLQQTTVAAVIPYYQRFIARWPDVQSLARASEDDVLKEWAGLGYYSRARNLLACARIVATQHGGVFPKELHALRALPGIGDYTAAAIRSIAFDLPATVIDGNVIRVLARLHGYEEPINMPAGRKQIAQWAHDLSPHMHPGDYAQGLMDVGATICTPRNPKCPQCPWQNYCVAYRTEKTDQIPVKIKLNAPRVLYTTALAIIDHNDQIFLSQRPRDGLLGGLWALPHTTFSNVPYVLDDPAWQVLETQIKHVFTHITLFATIAILRVIPHAIPLPGEWFPLSDLPGLSTLDQKLLAVVTQDRKKVAVL